MAKPPSSGPEKGDAAPDSSPKPDQSSDTADEKSAMEKTQKEAAEDWETDGGYQ